MKVSETISFNNKILDINNILVPFSLDIETVLEVDDGCVVLLSPTTGQTERNVYFVNPDGTIKWQIAHFLEGQGKTAEQKKMIGYVGYTGISMKEGKLFAFSFAGYDCEINIETGEIIECFFTK